MTTKDPDARLDYAWDWSAWLVESETIIDHDVTAVSGGMTVDEPDGVAIDGTDEDDGIVTAWVSGGITGTSARLTCHVVTSDGREDDRTRTITIRER